MRKLGLLVLVVGLSTTIACSDDKDAPPTPPTQSANGVFPASGFLGRKLRVEVSGDNTAWTSSTTATFGDGITVDQVTVASPTALFADITIAPTAAPGMRDVVVNDGTTTVTLMQAFEITSPIEVTWQGTVAQGSVAVFTIVNHDIENPFDDTKVGDGFFTPITFPNIAVTAPAGLTMSVSAVTAFKIQGVGLIDVDATGGAVDIQSGPPGGTITDFSLGADLQVTARTATALTSGTPVNGMIANPYDSDLYSLDIPTAPALAQLSATATGGSPGVILLPSPGHFADLIGYQPSMTTIAEGTGTYYAIIWDNTGASGYPYSFTGSALGLTAINEGNDTTNNTGTGAQAMMTLPGLLDNGNLSSVSDKDWIKITVAPADVGKHIHVITAPGDAMTDTLVDVFGPGGFTAAKLLGESDDLNYHEDFDSPALTQGGTYYIEISASQAGFFDPSMSHYVAAVFLD